MRWRLRCRPRTTRWRAARPRPPESHTNSPDDASPSPPAARGRPRALRRRAGPDVAAEHPRKLPKLSSTCTLPGAWQALSVGGAVNWESATPQRAANPVTALEEAVGQPAYTVVDLMARLKLGRQWALQLNVDNVFDKKYRTGNPWWSSFTYGEPRSARLKASYTY